MNEDVFSLYGRYYDLLYRDKDYAAEADYVVRTLRNSNPAARSIVEFGSGTGRHGRLLAERCFEVVGVERSGAMVTAAQRMALERRSPDGGSFECHQGDIRTFDAGRRFDVVLSLFHVMSYQTGNADLQSTFASAARHLESNGLFLFDVWHGPAVLSERPSVRVKRVEDESTRLWRLAEPTLDTNASTVTVNYTVLAASKSDDRLTTFEERHRMRYLFPADIDLLARHSGFDLERTEEFLTGQPPSEHTWGVAYLLRKTS
jgi:SAM-dependent methyltransferase